MQAKFVVTKVSKGAVMAASAITGRPERVIMTVLTATLDDPNSQLLGAEMTIQCRGDAEFGFDEALNVTIAPGNVISFPVPAVVN